MWHNNKTHIYELLESVDLIETMDLTYEYASRMKETEVEPIVIQTKGNRVE